MRAVRLGITTSFCALALAACGDTTPRPSSPPASGPAAGSAATTPSTTWRLPDGWRAETIPFPLGFAPELAHRGVEEIRFAPGMFDHTAPGYWSYVFVWRLEDAAALDAPALAAELALYFRGLVAAVDEQHRITARDEIDVVAVPRGDAFTLAAHTFDAFDTGLAIDLVGTATRTSCGTGSLWVIVLAPEASPLRAELDALAAEAQCGQRPPPSQASASTAE
jgi:hypothetical protein